MQQGSARPWAVKYISDHGLRHAAQARSSCRLRLSPGSVAPEASSITLHAHWPRITVTPVDVSIETHLTNEMLEKLSHTQSAAAQYIARYTRRPGDYLWDELAAAAWIDPSLITRERYVYMDVSIDKGISYGDTLVWSDEDKPDLELQKAHVQMDVDWPKFQSMFMQLMSSPTPNAKNPQMGAATPGPGK